MRRMYLNVEEGWRHSRQKEQPRKAQTPVYTLPGGPRVPLLDHGSCLVLWMPEFWNSKSSQKGLSIGGCSAMFSLISSHLTLDIFD